ncbi:PspC domain-containing protein [Rhizosaccharibacter radicis]|uniref:PspC domain-containing protein n=1 Tax=Rhizosaccharibacter radicis TaxID=2782605 RepID=A0ABT1VSJ8_9PROT|nr:PspC domain-containing protein [Acetobacteraceae bacterium KSS12]
MSGSSFRPGSSRHDAGQFAPAEASGRVWRQDGNAMMAGVCAGLAEDLDLPLPLVRTVAVLFLVLPTGLAYLALALILRRRPLAAAGLRQGFADGRWRTASFRGDGAQAAAAPRGADRADGSAVMRQDLALLRQRFAMLEPRLGNIEAFVTSRDFELHRDFRRMGD